MNPVKLKDSQLIRNKADRRIESGERPIDPRIQRSEITREELQSIFENPGEPEDTHHGKEDLVLSDTPPLPPSAERAKLTPELIRGVRSFLREHTLNSHRQAERLIAESRFDAADRWEDLHTRREGAHHFSMFDPALANDFARTVTEWVPDERSTRILELGTGYGNDLALMARALKKAEFVGVDNSPTAIREAKNNLRKLGLIERVRLVCGDYREELDRLRGSGQTMVYAHSTLHYHPALVLRDEIFPRIAAVLNSKGPKEQRGKLFLGMKTAVSASARASDKVRLLGNDMYHHNFDTRDGVFRIYPDRMKDVLRLLYSDFEIDDAYLRKLEGYDHSGDVEEFCYVVGTTRPLRPDVRGPDALHRSRAGRSGR